MEKKSFLNIMLVFAFIIFSYSFSFADVACKPPPPGPGGDSADENYSVSNLLTEYSALGKGTVSILNAGYWKEAEKLCSNFYESIYIVGITGNSKPGVVIIPSGGLIGEKTLADKICEKINIKCCKNNSCDFPVCKGKELKARNDAAGTMSGLISNRIKSFYKKNLVRKSVVELPAWHFTFIQFNKYKWGGQSCDEYKK